MTETKMEETKKSDAPMILGIIGFVSSLPGILCAGMCAGLYGASVMSLDAASRKAGGPGATGSHAAVGAGFTIFYFLLPIAVSVTAFIFSFMAKKSPKKAGIVLIVCSAVLLVTSVVSLNWFFGLITTGCYLAAGIISLKSAKK